MATANIMNTLHMIRKRILWMLLFLPLAGYGQLQGDYIIRSTNPNTDFTSLQKAVSKLNSVGVSGPVRFLLEEDQTVTSQITINRVSGSSAVNTVTIKPNTGKDITITANMPNNYTSVPAVFLLNGVSNIILDGSNSSTGTKNLTLLNTDELTYVSRSVIWIASNGSTSSSNIIVKNCILKFTNRSADGISQAAIYSGNNSIGGDNVMNVQLSSASNSNIDIANNDFVKVREGIYVNGSDDAKAPSSWKIRENNIGSTVTDEKPIRGMYISNLLNF